METTFDVEVLADGTIKTTTGKVGAQVHQNAEAFMRMMATLAGGSVERKARGDVSHAAHHHRHEQGHSH